MKKLVSIAVCSFAAAAFALPAGAADDAAKARAAGTVNAPDTRSDGASAGDNAGAGKRTGDAQARHDNNPEDKAPAKAKPRAQRKDDRGASSGASTPK